jgi:hypothetical protein
METPTFRHQCTNCKREVWSHRDCNGQDHMPQLQSRPDLPFCSGKTTLLYQHTVEEADKLGANIASASRFVS